MTYRVKRLARTARLLPLLALLLVAACATAASAQDAGVADDGHADERILRGQISDIKGMRRALLVASRSLAVDIRGQTRGVFDEVFGGRGPGRHKYAYGIISKRLEKYAQEGRGLQAVETLDEAEFVIVYKVVSEVRSFDPDEPFVFGTMYVILNKTPERPRPVLVWRTKGDRMTPDDAAREFVKALKDARGEK
jgi:hypothetical protein